MEKRRKHILMSSNLRSINCRHAGISFDEISRTIGKELIKKTAIVIKHLV